MRVIALRDVPQAGSRWIVTGTEGAAIQGLVLCPADNFAKSFEFGKD
jgi:hypothetical protein